MEPNTTINIASLPIQTSVENKLQVGAVVSVDVGFEVFRDKRYESSRRIYIVYI